MTRSSRAKITAVVADDHPLYRDGVVRALTASGQIDVVAEAGDGRAALAVIRELEPDDAPVLTDREQEILRLIADGNSLPEIAKQLFLGVTTVKTHVQHLYEKLGVSDRAAAVAVAMRRGLLE